MDHEVTDFDIYIPEQTATERTLMLSRVREMFNLSVDFRRTMGLPLPDDISDEDRKEALNIFHETPLAPAKPTTLGAALMLDNLLAKHDYKLLDPAVKMRNYVMFKLFELAEDPDPKVSMRALENLGKTNEINLFNDKIEVNINQRPTEELESELQRLVGNILSRSDKTNKRKSKPIDAEFREIDYD